MELKYIAVHGERGGGGSVLARCAEYVNSRPEVVRLEKKKARCAQMAGHLFKRRHAHRRLVKWLHAMWALELRLSVLRTQLRRQYWVRRAVTRPGAFWSGTLPSASFEVVNATPEFMQQFGAPRVAEDPI